MNTSSLFALLRRDYQAELDDLSTDTEGHCVLPQRLAEKRSELGFLLQMMPTNPELLAVVLHQAFSFKHTATMEHLVTQEAGHLPSWDSISNSIDVAPWARQLVETITQQPEGPPFMTIAAALEYLYHRPLTTAEQVQAEDDEETESASRAEGYDQMEALAHEAAGNDWMAEQGFDRKD